MMANKACVGIGVYQGGGQGIKSIDFQTPGNLLVPVDLNEGDRTISSFVLIIYYYIYKTF
jgi:hypothetical protein